MTTLTNRSVALSAAVAPDLGRLGLPAQEVDRAILSICGALIRAGATVIYSGDLRPEGITYKIFRHLAGLYAGQDAQPFSLFMPEHAARTLTFDQLSAAAISTASVSKISIVLGGDLLRVRRDEHGLVLLSRDNRYLVRNDAELEAALGSSEQASVATSLSSARSAVTQACDARVLIGGKMGIVGQPEDQFEGNMPGIVEEAMQTLHAGKWIFPLSAFGGATRDLSIALGLLSESQRVPRDQQDPRYAAALERATAFADASRVTRLADAGQFLNSDQVDYVGHQLVRFLEQANA